MRAPAVSFANKLWAAALAALLMFTLLPASALAEEEGGTADASTEELKEVSASQSDASSGVAPMLASGLVGTPTTFINSDVALDGDPIVGSFTVDGLTFAVTEGSDVELVGVSSDRRQVTSSQEGDESPVAPMLASGSDGLAADSSALAVPESITYNDVDYVVTSIGAYAFYLSGVASVELPASIAQIDDRAFRSSDVSSVTVADDNATYSSFDGALYDADALSLLLIPEGKQGTVLLPKTAESAAPSVFSHCPLVTQVSVEEGSAAFASENGLLYDTSLTMLLRVPAGATDITIRDGCTAIAAGAMEACASLATITAPASVTSISPDVFTSVPTVSLPVASAVADDPGASIGAAEEPSGQAGPAPVSGSTGTQLTAMVALSSADDDLPEVDPSAIEVSLPDDGGESIWQSLGISCRIDGNSHSGVLEREALGVDMQIAARSSALYTCMVNPAGRTLTETYGIHRKSDGAMVTLQTRDVSGWEWVSTQNVYYYNVAYDYLTFCLGNLGDESAYNYYYQYSSGTPGYSLKGFSTTYPTETIVPPQSSVWGACSLNAIWRPNTYTVALRSNGGSDMVPSSLEATYDQAVTLPMPSRSGYRFNGWNTAADGSGTSYQAGVTRNLTDKDKATITLYAQWEPIDFDLGFDVDSEPGDEDYPGIEKSDETVNVENGPTVIEDPKRPGYVFQGWTIPNAEGTEAIDQDLVYKDESDGKWYVDASKLPDYADDEGRVELTARWTSVISVDVPSAVTFYADVVTQGNESREGAASSAFGQNKVASQSQVDLRIVGLESTAVATQGSTLGADSILKKASSATPSSSTQKLFSLYPTDKALTPDDLQDPDAVSTTKPTDAVDFALDDLLLEKSFSADSFTIPAGDTLNLGYRLNLSETGTELDYDKLSTLDEGQSASIANISYCFAAKPGPRPTGSSTDPLYVTVTDPSVGIVGTYGLDDIKTAADDLSANGSDSLYYDFYKRLLDAQVTDNGNPGPGPYFKLKVNGVYWDLQLIGICQDTKTAGGKAGLTFQMRDIFSYSSRIGYPGSGPYASYMNTSDTNSGGWQSTFQRSQLRTVFLGYLDPDVQAAIVPVNKGHQVFGNSNETAAYLQKTTNETIWLPSMYEVFGTTFVNHNGSEGITTISGYAPFQYMGYQGSDGPSPNPRAVKKHYESGASASAGYLAVRSASPANFKTFDAVDPSGSHNGITGGGSYGVAPAFCL